MAVLVVVESINDQINKAGFELATYGYHTAKLLGTDNIALVIGKAGNADQLGVYGVSRVVTVAGSEQLGFDSQVYTSIIAEAAKQLGANTIILRNNANGKSIEGRLAVRLQAGSVSGVNALPSLQGEALVVSKSVYSGKAIVHYAINSDVKVLSLMGNAVQPEAVGSPVAPESISVNIPTPKVKVVERKTVSGVVPLPEAELVVSAGRGLKGPENWGIVEDLANVLGATTACSRPVADTGWRPHHEHVGQTGVAIRPNLYIALGISGAIQHLAGVNNSKVIVVVNKDPEAPFFKAADYGIVGDVFEVVPKLTEAFKRYKSKA